MIWFNLIYKSLLTIKIHIFKTAHKYGKPMHMHLFLLTFQKHCHWLINSNYKRNTYYGIYQRSNVTKNNIWGKVTNLLEQSALFRTKNSLLPAYYYSHYTHYNYSHTHQRNDNFLVFPPHLASQSHCIRVEPIRLQIDTSKVVISL